MYQRSAIVKRGKIYNLCVEQENRIMSERIMRRKQEEMEEWARILKNAVLKAEQKRANDELWPQVQMSNYKSDGHVKIRAIQQKLCELCNITMFELNGNQRISRIALLRHIGMFVSSINTSASTTQIGRSFGGRDHTTVIYGLRKVKKLVDAEDEFTVNLINQLINT